MKILIDNGHGVNTPGKCSPDGKFREYKYAREIATELVKRLKAMGYDAERIVPEEGDITLGQRCARVNAWCDRLGKTNVMLISIHNDAKGADGKWHEARGFSARVHTICATRSKELASLLWTSAIKHGLKGNRSVPPQMYVPQSLYILKNTKCAAVLTENLFQDNKEDVEFLLSDAGREAVINTHIEAIKQYVQRYERE